MYLKKIEQTDINSHLLYEDSEFLATELHKKLKYDIEVLLEVWRYGDTLCDSNNIIFMSSYDYYNYHLQCLTQGFKEDYVKLVHCYNHFEKDGPTYYVDSTGVTNDLNDILNNLGINRDMLSKSSYYHSYLFLKSPIGESTKLYYWSTFNKWYENLSCDKKILRQKKSIAKQFVTENLEFLTL